MKSLAVFVHYGESKKFPNYVEYYIKQLVEYFDEVIVTYNERPYVYKVPTIEGVKYLSIINEGYDFGCFYKVLKDLNTTKYHTIGFFNDSNVVFSSIGKVLEWGFKSNLDMWGITDSHECPPGVNSRKSYHIQSHFIVFGIGAIAKLNDFFKHIAFERFFDIKDNRILRLKIISNIEIGMSQYMLDLGLRLGSFFKSESFIPSVSKRDYHTTNVHIWLWKELILNGYPFIKKKLVVNGFDPKQDPPNTLPNFNNWQTVVMKFCNEEEFNKIFSELIKRK